MNLRKREFEILKAIGMSNKQFNKMFVYESLIYGVKSHYWNNIRNNIKLCFILHY